MPNPNYRSFIVKDIATYAPANAVEGDAYLISDAATGYFASKKNHIAVFHEDAESANPLLGWSLTVPAKGDYLVAANTTTIRYYQYDGSAWQPITNAVVQA